MVLELSSIVYYQNTSNKSSTMGIDAVAAFVNVLVLGMRSNVTAVVSCIVSVKDTSGSRM
jgi:hypothetical protein